MANIRYKISLLLFFIIPMVIFIIDFFVKLGETNKFFEPLFLNASRYYSIFCIFVLVLISCFVYNDWLKIHYTKQRKWGLLGLVILIASSVIYFVFFNAQTIPTSVITPLRETLGRENFLILYGRTEPNPAYMAVKFLLGSLFQENICLKNIIKMNLWFTVTNAIIFFAIASHILKKLGLAAVFTLLFSLNLISLQAAFSPMPTQLFVFLFFLGVLGASLAGDPMIRSGVKKNAIVLLMVLTGISLLIRPELALFGLLAVSSLVWKRNEHHPLIQKTQHFTYSIVHTFEKWPAKKRNIVLVLLFLPLLIIDMGPPWLWLVDGFHPLSPSIATLPFALSYFLPASVIILFLFGMIYALRNNGRFVLLPVTVIILFRVYYSAACEGGAIYEILRYLGNMVPAIFLLAVIGWREFVRFVENNMTLAKWKHSIVAIMFLLFFAWLPASTFLIVPEDTSWKPLFSPPSLNRPEKQWSKLLDPLPLLSRNRQTEVRYLLDLVVEKYPDCLFVSRVYPNYFYIGEKREYELVYFGQRLKEPKMLSKPGEPLNESLTLLYPKEKCVLYYYGLDCNLINSDSCEQDIENRSPLETLTFRDLPYSYEPEYGTHKPAITLGVYSVR